MVQKSVGAVTGWVEAHDFRAYDPGDGNLSFLRHFTFNSHTLRQVLTASVLRTPFEIRPLLGIKPHRSTKGMGYMGWGYVKMYGATREASHRARAEHCFEWLIRNRAPGYEQHCCEAH